MATEPPAGRNQSEGGGPAPPPLPPPLAPPPVPPPGWEPPGPRARYVGIPRRFFAWVVDWLVLFVINVVIYTLLTGIEAATASSGMSSDENGAFGALTIVVNVLVNLAYYTFFWSHEGGGRTFGSRVLGIRVLRTNGELASAPRALARAILMYLSIIAVFLGVLVSVITILTTSKRQALQDLICDTVVERT